MRRGMVTGLVVALLAGWLLALAPLAGSARVAHAATDLPAVDPEYIYTELATLVTAYQHREAGYGQPGHDGFANAWSQEMAKDLQAFHPTIVMDKFTISGWTGRPATQPAYNVEVSIPGVSDPGQVVVIGCHYDGEASSTQSANDDGSGCAIELGVAKAMATYWLAHGLAPARTLRFVAFDAEEQGIFGSFHYVDQTINGDLANVVAMINEEQSGIGYPLRFLGNVSNPTLPMGVLWTPLASNQSYPQQSATLLPAERANIQAFDALTNQATPAVFAEFRALGYTSLDYQGTSGTVSQQIFTPDQAQSDIQAMDDNVAGSDNFAFGLVGIPTATFIGNYSYYDNNPPPWSYPYDQPQDTIQMMNMFASGTPQESPALRLSLALPGMLTAWLLAQPSVVGSVAIDRNPVASITDIGPTLTGQPVSFAANAEDSQGGTSALTYAWTFGDGGTAGNVAQIEHAYAQPGTYTLKLTVHSNATGGTRTVTKTIDVTAAAPQAINPYADPRYAQNGVPPANPQVTLPKIPGVSTGPAATATPVGVGGGQGSVPLWLVVVIVLVAIVMGATGFLVWAARRRRAA